MAGASWSLRAKAPWLLGVLMLFDSWDSVVIAYTLPVLLGEMEALGAAGGLASSSAGYGGQFLGAMALRLARRALRAPAAHQMARAGDEPACDCVRAWRGRYEQLIALRALQG